MRAEILIVGGGVAGLATASFLARAGARGVVLLEREATLGEHSSGRNAAILRSAVRDPIVRELAREGSRFLRRPPASFARRELIDPCGVLLLADARGAGELETLARELDADAGFELTTPQQARALAPHFTAGDGCGLFARREGRIDIAELVDAFARGARSAGVELRTHTPVAELLVSGATVEGVRLQDGAELRAARTVLAAGGWAATLAARAGSQVALRPTRRHLAVTAPPRAALGAPIDPRWPVVWTTYDEMYARPESGGLLLSACDQTTVDPEDCRVDASVLEALAERCTRHLRDAAELCIARLWCGMRTLCSDGRFAVGPDPDLRGLFWVAGLGGHGMVCSAPVGRLAAELLLDRADAHLARALDPARLRAARAQVVQPRA